MKQQSILITKFIPVNVNTLVASNSPNRIRLAFYPTTIAFWFSTYPMTGANQGISIFRSNQLGFVLDRKIHGSIVTQSWYVWSNNSNNLVIEETF